MVKIKSFCVKLLIAFNFYGNFTDKLMQLLTNEGAFIEIFCTLG